MRSGIFIALVAFQQQRLACCFRSETSAAGSFEARDAERWVAEPPVDGYYGVRGQPVLLLLLALMGAACLVIYAVVCSFNSGIPFLQAARQRAFADLQPEPLLGQVCRQHENSEPDDSRPKAMQWSWLWRVLMFLVACACIATRTLMHQGYNEVLKWATRHQCHNVAHEYFSNVVKPDLLVLQGRPKEMSFKLYTSRVFKEVRKMNTTFFPKPANRDEWICELIRTYRNVLDEYFANSDAPYVITAEDDVEVNGNLDNLEDHIMSVLATVRDGFYSFYHTGDDGTCSYRWGTQLIMIRREFMQELHKTCFNQCNVPIDLCISGNWNFRMAPKRLVRLPPPDISTNPDP